MVGEAQTTNRTTQIGQEQFWEITCNLYSENRVPININQWSESQK